jgi:peptidyl-prolyl cis-trans isomerase SurA
VFRRQVLERMIVDKIQLQRAHNTGIRITDEQLNQSLAELAQRNHMSLDQFAAAVQQDGVTFSAFRDQLRDQLTVEQLRQRDVARRITVSDREVDNYLAAQAKNGDDNNQYHLQHILITVRDGTSPDQLRKLQEKAEDLRQQLVKGADFSQVAIANSSGAQALEGGDLGWRKLGELPTLFTEQVRKMHPGDISPVVRSPSGFHIFKLVDVRGGEETAIVNETHARHILIRTNAMLSDAQAQDKLKNLREQILAGGDFAELAKKYSQDPGSAPKGGDLGWLTPGVVVESFQQQMDKLQPGQVSQPFQTRYGWHLVQVLERRQRNDTEQARREHAKDAIFQRKMEEELDTWIHRLRDEAYVEVRLDQPTS